MSLMNRIHNSSNPYQGNFKRVLCVCSAGLLRSPTTAWVLSQEPYNHNTRAAGVHSYALVPVDPALLQWAQEIVCMEQEHADAVARMVEASEFSVKAPVRVLGVPDRFPYRDPDLVALIKERYDKVSAD